MYASMRAHWSDRQNCSHNVSPKLRKILVSVKFLSVILGPEMGASILWTPGKMRSFCRKKTHVHKIPRFRGGVFWVLGGGSADFIFMGARIFLKNLNASGAFLNYFRNLSKDIGRASRDTPVPFRAVLPHGHAHFEPPQFKRASGMSLPSVQHFS